MMMSTVALVALGMIVVAMLLCLYRLLVGPSLPDRIIALDTLYVNAIASLIVLGVYFRTSLYFEAVLLIAMLGFVGTCALAKFLLRGDIME